MAQEMNAEDWNERVKTNFNRLRALGHAVQLREDEMDGKPFFRITHFLTCVKCKELRHAAKA